GAPSGVLDPGRGVGRLQPSHRWPDRGHRDLPGRGGRLLMEAVIFVGIQASGKSSFYRERFFPTHVRISPDLLRTRRRERSLLAWCLENQQSFVVDNTNPTIAERAVYITPAKTARFRVVGYIFDSDVSSSLGRGVRYPALRADWRRQWLCRRGVA